MVSLEIFLSIYYGTMSYNLFAIFSKVVNIERLRKSPIHWLWSGKHHIHQFIWTLHKIRAITSIRKLNVACNFNGIMGLLHHTSRYEHRSWHESMTLPSLALDIIRIGQRLVSSVWVYAVLSVGKCIPCCLLKRVAYVATSTKEICHNDRPITDVMKINVL